ASGELQESAMNRLQVGTEYLIGNLEEKINILALRAGYQANYPNPQLTGLTGLTLGLGYTITRSMTLDYAMVPAGELGTSHRFSLTFKFDCPEKAKPQAAAAPQPEPAPKAAYVEPQPIVLKSILLEDSHFDFDKSILRPEGMQALWENIQILKDNPKALVRIEGYTSMSGTAEYNQLLSERRAKAVEDFLVTEGEIKPGRITAVGYGAAWPETYEPTPGKINSAAAKSNMRVLFTVTVK
ncbi:MAG: OmpA family protein, partial [Elusimicrobiales bacterium]